MPSRSLNQIPIHPQGLRTRFAPSPTGFLHLGHVASAIYVWGLGRKLGAEIILRMEDHDQSRSRKSYEESILDDLHWLGFQADQGVRDASQKSEYRQSDHPERYEKALHSLKSQIYACNCSRKDILERTGPGHDELKYDGFCRSLNKGPNIRLRLAAETLEFNDLHLGRQVQSPSEQCGDLLLKDRDGYWTYNFAVAVDDMADAINLVIRGQDLLAATGRQIQLRASLNARETPSFYHHPLIWADETHKLSKRDRSTSIAQWKAEGHSAEALIGKAAFQVGLISEEHPLKVSDLPGLFA